MCVFLARDAVLITHHASPATRPAQVCERAESDKKGGHLARSVASGGLLLRESAQCAAEDEAAFQVRAQRGREG